MLSCDGDDAKKADDTDDADEDAIESVTRKTIFGWDGERMKQNKRRGNREEEEKKKRGIFKK